MFLARTLLRPSGGPLSRALTTAAPGSIAFAFDIDGVLIRGGKALPTALTALQRLDANRIPFLLLTNGGGYLEEKRVEALTTLIGYPFHKDQIVQSHTPCKALVKDPQYGRVLVIGGRGTEAKEAALAYGFPEVVTPVELFKANPAVYPFGTYTQSDLSHAANVEVYGPAAKPITAILVFSDPRDFGTSLQLTLDLLNSNQGRLGTRRANTETARNPSPAIPIIFSNNDLLWANEYPVPRFGQGAFRIAVEALYQATNGVALESTILGKPFRVSYDYAHQVLANWKTGARTAPVLNVAPHPSPFSKVYMVGDNPASDIMGANNYGWESLLVRTGVYEDADWEEMVARPTGGVFDNVDEAVKWAVAQNGST